MLQYFYPKRNYPYPTTISQKPKEIDKSSMAKWEGKASTTLTKASDNQIWSLFSDFFNNHKWFPNMSTSYGVHGDNGKVGCIRYCGGFSIEGNAGQVNWAKEWLLAIDPDQMFLSYEIVESSLPLTSYISMVKVVNVGGQGCVVEWSFSVDPVEGLTCEYLVERYQDILDRMTMKMEVDVVEKNGD
ncbi:hypothetical protein LXL04_026157 [Taraxacum kok-saghyz]